MSEPRNTARARASLGRAVPLWPFVSPDGRAGGFVRTASRRPGGGGTARGNDEGVLVGPLSGAPQWLDCGVPSAPPVFDSGGRTLLLCHEVEDSPGGASRISLVRFERSTEDLVPLVEPVPLGEVPGSVQQLLWDEPAGRILALVAEPGADTAALASGRRGAARPAEPEVDEGPIGGQSIWSVSLATGRAANSGRRRCACGKWRRRRTAHWPASARQRQEKRDGIHRLSAASTRPRALWASSTRRNGRWPA